jgi:hypothetical protein
LRACSWPSRSSSLIKGTATPQNSHADLIVPNAA